MGTKMTLSARAELTNAVRRRYSAVTGAEKRKILDEFIAVTGYHEKSAIRALNAEPTVKKRQTRVRPSLYDEAVRAALIVLWEASDRVCGKRLGALLPILLPALERNGHLYLADPMRQKILAVGRVEAWRADFRLRWLFHRFRVGPQSGGHHHVSSPPHRT